MPADENIVASDDEQHGRERDLADEVRLRYSVPLTELVVESDGGISIRATTATIPSVTTQRRAISGGPVVAAVTSDDYVGVVLEVAHDLAERLGLQLVVAHVQPGDIPPGVSAAPGGQSRLLEARATESTAFLDALLAEHAPRLDARRIVVSGGAATELENIAREERASMLVIGSAGKGALASALQGSVSRHVATRAPCPVVVVPPAASERQ